ncbi:MAG: hypothetical protein ABIP55_09280 [Tepidisphaeraceae bacterium]
MIALISFAHSMECGGQNIFAESKLEDARSARPLFAGYFPSSPIRPLTPSELAKGWGAVGKIECSRAEGGIWLGSGAIILSEARTDIVLTVAHNFFSGSTGERLRDCAFTTGEGRAQITAIEMGTQLNPHIGKTADDFAKDWAVVLLDRKLSASAGALGIIRLRPDNFGTNLNNCTFFLAGYHRKINGMGVSYNCTPMLGDHGASIKHEYIVPHNCSGHSGSSGGPLVCERAGGLFVSAIMFRHEDKREETYPFDITKNANYARLISSEIDAAIRKVESLSQRDSENSGPP